MAHKLIGGSPADKDAHKIGNADTKNEFSGVRWHSTNKAAETTEDVRNAVRARVPLDVLNGKKFTYRDGDISFAVVAGRVQVVLTKKGAVKPENLFMSAETANTLAVGMQDIAGQDGKLDDGFASALDDIYREWNTQANNAQSETFYPPEAFVTSRLTEYLSTRAARIAKRY